MIPQLSQNDSKLSLKWSQNDPKLILRWSQNSPKVIQKWSQNYPKNVPTFVYYSTGDRAQKVIPKLSPEARKQTRASESLKIRSTKINFMFPNILFTIALVIERKELSPEARKQTRASESFKKINFTFAVICRSQIITSLSVAPFWFVYLRLAIKQVWEPEPPENPKYFGSASSMFLLLSSKPPDFLEIF